MTLRRSWHWALCLLVFRATSAWADSSVQRELLTALEEVKAKEYEHAIARTQKPLDQLQLETVEEIILAHKILGVSYCELGDLPKASEHFKALTTFARHESIDDLVRTEPCVSLFATFKPAKPASNQLIALEPPGIWLYVPFGVGQFENREKKKGIFFLVSESATIGISVTSLLLFHSERNTSGNFDHPERASFYRSAYYSTLGLAGALMVWGIVDAVRNSKKKKERLGSRSHVFHFSGPFFLAEFK